jgi:hypothetical protein
MILLHDIILHDFLFDSHKKNQVGGVLWDKTIHKKPCGYVGTWGVYKPVIDFIFGKKKL